MSAVDPMFYTLLALIAAGAIALFVLIFVAAHYAQEEGYEQGVEDERVRRLINGESESQGVGLRRDRSRRQRRKA